MPRKCNKNRPHTNLHYREEETQYTTSHMLSSKISEHNEFCNKQVSMPRKCNNNRPHTNLHYREEETQYTTSHMLSSKISEQNEFCKIAS